jgi:Xaa-Pro aminopeptidase
MPIDHAYASDNAWTGVIRVGDEEARKGDWTGAMEEALGGSVKRLGVSAPLSPARLEWVKKIGAEAVDIREPVLEPMFSALDPAEWLYQKRATEIVDLGQEAAYEAIRPGASTSEVAVAIAAAELKAGADEVGYLQVSAGRRSAYSHDSASGAAIRDGDLVLVDLCPSRGGYASDETRTYVAGRAQEKAARMIEAVNRSVEAVLARIRPGAVAGDLDATARASLAADGYAGYPHGLGHPLSGCTQPALRSGGTHVLRPGSVFTVEPGLYEAGYGGVRIEENVLVAEDGYEVLTKRPRTYM